ncbi:heavy metal-binding domain-containing protein [uncultured Winogradskyella sp.]|uniref:YbjQ family protein n=1 Tax=uncultured Winogradskyella sp. TaxID=395353 RepID=UPI00262CCDFF|nr:heavy metal-binding domain-containing protein [uncultured Winogradskyella sp.]
MILTTTNSIEGYKIIDYLGIVTGVAINKETLAMGFSMSKYYTKIQGSIETIKEEAFQNLRDNASKLKANAVVGIKVEVEFTTSNYPIVSVTGTAVKVAV